MARKRGGGIETVAGYLILWRRVFVGPVCSDNTSLAEHGAVAISAEARL